MDEFVQSNLKLWNEWTDIHEKSASYDLPGFMSGRDSLHPLELEELGPDVKPGTTLLHLQCHFGLDTLSWARRGARVTGVDFSQRAIDLARRINSELNLGAEFICSDVYALPDILQDQFDVVYTSYGVLNWIPDAWKWARVAAHFVKPGGIFYIAEFHPFFYIFENEGDDLHDLEIKYPYFTQDHPLEFPVSGSYADPSARVNHPVEYDWTHNLGEVASALIAAGLTLHYLHEFPFSVEASAPALMEKGTDGYWRLKEKQESVPLMYSIKAGK